MLTTPRQPSQEWRDLADACDAMGVLGAGCFSSLKTDPKLLERMQEAIGDAPQPQYTLQPPGAGCRPAGPTLTEDDVRRIVRDELRNFGLLKD